MVDMALPVSEDRSVTITFLECGWLIPHPTMEPITASNGVLVAHPIDLITTNLEKLSLEVRYETTKT